MPIWGRRGDTRGHGPEEVPGYTRLEPIGRGGFSVVYRAHQEALGRLVALKLLTAGFADDALRRRFLREVRLTTKLTGHPHVVTVLDAGTTRSGHPYIAMEYFERGSLQDHLETRGVLPAAAVVDTGVKVASALSAAHELGILHRDVKPQNILVSRFGEPALADFGVACVTSAIDTSTRTVAFTPCHAAPEVLQGGELSPATDVYALGSTLYQLLAGRAAYRHEGSGGIAALLLRVLEEPPPPIGRTDLPPGLAESVFKAMAKDPASRYPTAAAFAAALAASPAGPARGGAVVTGREPGLAGLAAGPGEIPPAVAEPAVRAGRGPALPATRDLAWIGDTTEPPGGIGSPEHAGDETVLRPGRAQAAAASSASHASGRRRWLLASTAALLVVALGLAGGLLFRHAAAARGRPPAPSPAVPASPVSPSVLAAARPAGLHVDDHGLSVTLGWTVRPGPRYAMFVQVTPARGHSTLQPAGTGAQTMAVTGLNPRAGYCFRVGALVALGDPSTVAWSAPACIRGAVASAGRG